MRRIGPRARLCSARKRAGSSCASHHSADRQRNGAAEDVIGIVTSFGFDEPLDTTTIALHHAIDLRIHWQKVRVSARKRHRIESPQCVANPLPMSPLLMLVQSIDERGENLDQYMVATKAEGRRP